MRVLLVHPSPQGIYNAIGLILPPLGSAYLASATRKHHEIEIVDLQVMSHREFSQRLENVDVVAITALTNTFPAALHLAREAKEKKRTVVMGGYHPTFQDEETLLSSWVDVVVRGEGEETLKELLDALEEQRPLDTVQGITFQRENQIIRTPSRIPPQNLDLLPFPTWDLLPLSQYWMTQVEGEPLMTLVTSRGCPFQCTFCASSRFAGSQWRARSPENIIQELERIYFDWGYRGVAFLDDNFTLSPPRVERLCEKIEQRRLKIKWWCFSRADTIARHESTIQKMAKAGLRMVYLGLESAEKTLLDEYRKNLTTEITHRAISILRKYGVRVWGSFILGGLKETQETIKKTIEFAQKINLDFVQFSLLTPFPGTPLYEDLREESRILPKSWFHFDGAHPVIRLENIKPQELQRWLMKSYLAVYQQKKYLPTVASFLKKYLILRIPWWRNRKEQYYLRRRIQHENSSLSTP